VIIGSRDVGARSLRHIVCTLSETPGRVWWDLGDGLLVMGYYYVFPSCLLGRRHTMITASSPGKLLAHER